MSQRNLKNSERARPERRWVSLAAAPVLVTALLGLASSPAFALPPYEWFAPVQTPAQPAAQLTEQMFNIASVLQGGGSPALAHQIPAPMDATTMAQKGLNWDGMGALPYAFQSPWSFSTTKDFNTVTEFNPGFVTPYFDGNGVLDAGSPYAPWNSLPGQSPFIAPYEAPVNVPVPLSGVAI